MNYIQSLQDQVSELRTQKDAVNEQITSLMAYINSPKFQCGDELDGYVNISDVMSRLIEMRSSIS